MTMPQSSEPGRRAILGLAAAAVGTGLAASLAKLFPWQRAGRDGDESVADAPYDARESEPNLSVTGLADDALGECGITRMMLGHLPLPSGAVIAADPLVQPERAPFTRKVTPGDYPVTLYLADGRVALAELRFANGRPERWDLALVPGQDIATLKSGEIFGYPVDAGLGCFMDPVARDAMRRREALEEKRNANYSNYFDNVLLNELKGFSLDGLMHRPLPDDAADIAIFASGWGDGVYASFWSLDAEGRPLQLVTDFGVLENGKGRDKTRIARAAKLAAMSPEQRRDSAAGYAALKGDDLTAFSALLEEGRITPETLVEEVGGSFTFEAIRLDKPQALERLVRHGAPLTMPDFLRFDGDTRTYPEFFRESLPAKSSELRAVVGRWRETGSLSP